MHLVVDENLSFSEYYFSEFGAVTACAGRLITQNDLLDADALLVRSVTRVNRALLDHTPVRFVGSATIGTDHLDLDALTQMGVQVAHAPGCNAQAVAEYVVTAIVTLQPEVLQAGSTFCLGVVGLGNVGRRLVHLAQRLGWRVLGCDPYVDLPNVEQMDLSSLLHKVDAISLHVPLTKTGDHPTYHLMNDQLLAQLPSHVMLINSARGAVISQSALLADLKRHPDRPVVLDVFEFEPHIPSQLIEYVRIATPHIAGYSLEGKVRGTQMIYDAFCAWRGLTPNKHFEMVLPAIPQKFDASSSLNQQLAQHLQMLYPILRDDANLRACLQHGQVDATSFDRLRKDYPLRREWAAYGDMGS